MNTRREILRGGLGLAGIIAAGKAPAAIVKSLVGANGAKNVEDEKKDYTAADYVQDGLVSLFDGIENEGYGVHTDSNGPWVDLVSGDSYGKFQGRPYPERLEDGFAWHNEQYVGFAATTSGSYIAASQIEVVLRVNYNQTAAVIQNSKTTGFKFCLANVDGQTVVPLQYGGNKACYAGTIGNKNSISINAEHGWTNGRETTFSTATRTGYGFNYWDRVSIVAYQMQNFNQQPQYLDGDIHCIRLYNRVLSASEIAYNYKIDKARFGI